MRKGRNSYFSDSGAKDNNLRFVWFCTNNCKSQGFTS
jgi:hypothetical protein